MLNGNSRDFNVDTKGNLLLVEVATTLDAVPAAAKASILNGPRGPASGPGGAPLGRLPYNAPTWELKVEIPG